jgi:MarR family transcriptional regulator, 2-MHQ and catechol-resistance regulon repressor
VRRRPCPDDRRALYAELTPEGTTRMEEIFPAHAAALEAAVSGLSARDQERAVALLKQLGLGAAARAGGADAAPSRR